MLSSINLSHIFVNDHQQALDFYVGKLGLEVAQDVPLGFMRWLIVRVPGEIAHEILLEIPGPPGIDEKSAGQIRELISKGASGFAAGFTTPDATKTFASLKAKGVDVTQEPNQQPYGTDFGIRDPFGIHIRIVQLAPDAVQAGPKKASRS